MIVTKKSPLTGKVHSMDLAITPEQLAAYEASNQLIQEAFPHLTAEEREFLMTGLTPEEWDEAFKDED